MKIRNLKKGKLNCSCCCFLILFFCFSQQLSAQECLSSITIILKNTKGGSYPNQLVTLTNKADANKYTQQSNASGQASFSVPCNSTFNISIANYTRKVEILSDETSGGGIIQTFTYEPNMAVKDALFEMSSEEEIKIDNFVKTLPDTITLVSSRMGIPRHLEYYSLIDITIKDLDNKPLVNEQLSIVGAKSRKVIRGATNKGGHLYLYLPKGDKYFIDFKYKKNFTSIETFYTKGFSEQEFNFSYIGTEKFEKKKKELEKELGIEFEKEEKELKTSINKLNENYILNKGKEELFCSVCKRSKSTFESQNEGFYEHVKSVNGQILYITSYEMYLYEFDLLNERYREMEKAFGQQVNDIGTPLKK